MMNRLDREHRMAMRPCHIFLIMTNYDMTLLGLVVLQILITLWDEASV